VNKPKSCNKADRESPAGLEAELLCRIVPIFGVSEAGVTWPEHIWKSLANLKVQGNFAACTSKISFTPESTLCLVKSLEQEVQSLLQITELHSVCVESTPEPLASEL